MTKQRSFHPWIISFFFLVAAMVFWLAPFPLHESIDVKTVLENSRKVSERAEKLLEAVKTNNIPKIKELSAEIKQEHDLQQSHRAQHEASMPKWILARQILMVVVIFGLLLLALDYFRKGLGNRNGTNPE